MSSVGAIEGGHLADIPQPWIRYWPDHFQVGIRRQVTVKVYTWRGMSLGAKPWYAKVELEGNPVWDSRDAASWGRPGFANGWRRAWDDPEALRKAWDDDLLTETAAWDFVGRTIRKQFDLREVVFMVDDPKDGRRLLRLLGAGEGRKAMPHLRQIALRYMGIPVDDRGQLAKVPIPEYQVPHCLCPWCKKGA